MKKLYALAVSALVAVGGLSASAEVVQNYTESFETLTASDVLEHDFAPVGWNHIVDSYMGDYESYYVTYSFSEQGGVDGGAFLSCGDQTIGDHWEAKDANDMLVTPAVTGDVSMCLKLTSGNGSVKIFTVTENEGTFTAGEEYAVELPELSSGEWTKVNLPSVAAGTYLGIRLEQAAIDEFTAASADIVLKKALAIVGSPVLATGDKVFVNEQGDATVGFNVMLENTGDVDLEAGAYTLSLVDNSNEGVELGTPTTVNVALAAGEKTAEPVYVEATFKVELGDGEESWRHRIDVRENVSNTSVYGAWIEAVLYEGLLAIREEGASADLENLSFGMFQGTPVSKTVVLRNDGGKPVVVSAINAPSGYTFDLSCPITLNANEKKNLVITLGVDEPGDRSGTIEFVNDGKNKVAVAVSGTVIGGNTFYESFEGGEVPQGWLVPDGGWRIVADPNYDLQSAGNKLWMESSSVSDLTKLVTPKLAFGESEAIVFRAAKRAQYTQSVLNVYYSADRQNWHLVKTVDCDESTGNDHFSSETVGYGSYYNDNFEFTQFRAEIPQGEWYVAFEAGYCFLDDVYGGEPVAVEHDFYITASEIPATATVNYEYTASVTVKNMAASAEAADAYTVKLYVNGEAVAEAETEELAAGAEKTYALAYTPHASGDFTAWLEIAAGSYKLVTEEVAGAVAAEQALQKSVVGSNTGETREAPAFTFWKHSMTQTVYTADLLNLPEGAKIAKISFDGYNTNKELTHHVKVWMENTDDGVYQQAEPVSTDGMTLVYDSDYTFKVEGSYGGMVEMLVLPLTEQFVYTGKNLRVVVESRGDATTSIYFAADTSVANTTINKRTDGDDYETLTWNISTAGMPVMNVYAEKSVLTASGKVADKDGEAVEGAMVQLVSGNVLYSAVTGADGAYSMEVFQSEKEYTLTVSKEGYIDFVKEGVSFAEGSVVNDVVLEESGESGIGSAEAVAEVVYGGQGEICVSAKASRTVNVYDLSGRLIRSVEVEEGTTRLTGFEAGIYIVDRQKVAVK